MMKVILPVRLVPHGTIVSKPTGQKKYRLVRDLKLYTGAGVEVIHEGQVVLNGSTSLMLIGNEDMVAVEFTGPAEGGDFLLRIAEAQENDLHL